MQSLIVNFRPYMEAANETPKSVHEALLREGVVIDYYQVYRALSGMHKNINGEAAAALFRHYGISVQPPFELVEFDVEEKDKSH
jgi:hypothetical protein